MSNELNLEFNQVVFTLTNEYLKLFENEASAREIGLWVKSIPYRFPAFKLGRLLAAVKETVNKNIG